MTTLALQQHLTVDASRTIHLKIPPEMGAEVDVIVLARKPELLPAPAESPSMTCPTDGSGLARQVLNSPEEDCWNDL